MTPRREATATAVLALLAALALFGAAGARWAHGTGQRAAGGTYVLERASVSGRTVSGVVEAVALVALASAVAVPATRGRGRVAAGVLTAVGGIAAAVGAVASRGSARMHVLADLPAGASVTVDPWWVLALAGGVALTVAGAVLAVRGPRWSALSARYETPAARSEKRPADAGTWDALDRGEDPTT